MQDIGLLGQITNLDTTTKFCFRRPSFRSVSVFGLDLQPFLLVMQVTKHHRGDRCERLGS